MTIDFADLQSGVDVSDKIEKAFGFEGLGILAVKGVQGFEEDRKYVKRARRK